MKERVVMSNDLEKKGISTDQNIENIEKKIFTPFTVKLLMADFLLLILTYGGFYRSIFANSDTLWGVLDPSSTLTARLNCYRWIAAIFEIFFNETGLLPALNFRLSFFMFLCLVCISLFLIQIAFIDLFESIYPSKSKEPLFIVAVISSVSLGFVNVLFTEFFYFTETFHAFGMAFLLMGIGFYALSKKHIIVSLLSFFCMTMCYQMSCPIITICIGVYVYMEHRGELSLNLVKDEIIKAVPPMAFFVLNYATGPIIQRSLAVVGIESYQAKSPATGYELSEYIALIVSSIKELVSSNLGLTPRVYAPVFIWGIAFVVVVTICIKNKKWNHLLTYLLVEVALVVLLLAVQVAENPGGFVARTISTFYFAQSMQLLIMIFFLAERHDNYVFGSSEKILYILPALYVLFNIFFVQCIIENRIVSDTLDSLYAEKIFDKIESYEKETGIVVSKIAPINDTDCSPFYDQVYFCRGAINRRCYSDYTWTFLQYCAYETDLAGSLSGRSFERVAMDDNIYREYFEGKNWNSFNMDEQVIICEDTAYICVF